MKTLPKCHQPIFQGAEVNIRTPKIEVWLCTDSCYSHLTFWGHKMSQDKTVWKCLSPTLGSMPDCILAHSLSGPRFLLVRAELEGTPLSISWSHSSPFLSMSGELSMCEPSIILKASFLPVYSYSPRKQYSLYSITYRRLCLLTFPLWSFEVH